MPFRYIRAGLLFVLIGLDFAQSIYNRYFNDETRKLPLSTVWCHSRTDDSLHGGYCLMPTWRPLSTWRK